MEKAAARKKMEMVRNGDIELFKESEQVLEKLELPAAVVSNAFGDILEEIVIEFGIDRHLEYWIAPRLEEIETYHSIWKPETHMLEKAMEEMGSENPVMVGDDWFDIKSADNARIDSVLVERGHNDIEIEPTHRLSSLKELKEIVDESQS
ncbi:MAG: HAD family hydrolase [Candidatus Nanohaloarchaea archaeon]